MKIRVDNDQVYELTETQKKVLKNDINADEFEDDIKRRVRWVVEHKYGSSLKRLKDEWIPKLKESGVQSIPLNDELFAELVFAHKDYKDRKLRDTK